MSGRDASSEHARGQGAHQNRGTSELGGNPNCATVFATEHAPRAHQNRGQNRTATRTATRTEHPSERRPPEHQRQAKPEPEVRQPEHNSSASQNQNFANQNTEVRHSETRTSASRTSEFGHQNSKVRRTETPSSAGRNLGFGKAPLTTLRPRVALPSPPSKYS